MASIQLAIENSQAIDVEAKSADDLLAELVGDNSVMDDEPVPLFRGMAATTEVRVSMATDGGIGVVRYADGRITAQ